jgi:superfamily II DNA/RNA helicase
VLDEFDRLMDLGFAPQLKEILSQLPSARQTLMFSATPAATDDWEAVGMEPLVELSVLREAGHPLGETFFYLKSAKRKPSLLLEKLKDQTGQSIIFVGNREKANHLHGLLKMNSVAAQVLHGARAQEERAQVFQDFRQNRFPVLVATDLAGRGVDFPDVELIVNFDAPKNAKDYIHRSGRTARRNRAGLCLTFLGPDDWLPYRSFLKTFPALPEPETGFHNIDAWKAHAKRVHQAKMAREAKTEFIRREQGLD